MPAISKDIGEQVAVQSHFQAVYIRLRIGKPASAYPNFDLAGTAGAEATIIWKGCCKSHLGRHLGLCQVKGSKNKGWTVQKSLIKRADVGFVCCVCQMDNGTGVQEEGRCTAD